MKKLVMFLTLMLASSFATADLAVIVHPSNSNSMEASAISRIFMGKAKSFPDGSQAVPVNQTAGSAATDEFNSKVLKKSASQLKAYWSKLVFTGKGTPPKEMPSDAEVIGLIAANPNMIGFVDAAAVDGSVKVLATF